MKALVMTVVGIAVIIAALLAFGQWLIWSDEREMRLWKKPKWKPVSWCNFSRPWVFDDWHHGSKNWTIECIEVRRRGLRSKLTVTVRDKNSFERRDVDARDFRNVDKAMQQR